MQRNKLVLLVSFVLKNFGPLVAFYSLNHVFGFKAAIAGSCAWTVGEIVIAHRRGEKTTALFKFSAAMTLVFSAVDLMAQRSLLFKYEAVITNLITAGFFAVSLKGHRSVIQEFYERMPKAKPMTKPKARYFRLLTAVWVFYFVLKAGAYAWIASRYSLEQGLLIRTLVGAGSFYALLAVSIFGSRRIFPALLAQGWLGRADESQAAGDLRDVASN